MFFNEVPVLFIVKMYKKTLRQQEFLLKEYDLTEQQMLYMMIIRGSKGGIRLFNLAELLEVDKSNITRIVKQLEDKGYVERDIKTPGARKYKVILSERGSEVAKVIFERQCEARKRIFEGITPEEQITIEKFFAKFAMNDLF